MVISIREVVDPSEVDLFEEGLLLPVPAPEKNSIHLEERDGSDVRRLAAKAIAIESAGKSVFSLSDIHADVFVTDARLAFACSKYEKGGGWGGFGVGAVVAVALNAGSMALAAGRRRGKMLVGQVRYPWIRAVGSSSKSGWLTDETLYLYVKSPDGDMHLRLCLPKEIDAASAAAEIARRAAAYRLACEEDFKDEARVHLESLVDAIRLEPEKGAIQWHRFPTYWMIGEKSARFAPRHLVSA